MSVHQETIRSASSLPVAGPQAVSPETLAVIEREFTRVLCDLRSRAAAPEAAEAAEIEYRSWFAPPH